MSIEQAVRQAKSPQEALVVIARALDQLAKQLESRPTDDGWGGEWFTDPEGKVLDDLDDLDPEDRAKVMEARARLAQDKPGQYAEHAMEAGKQVASKVSSDEITVELPPVDEERAEQRRKFATEVAKLSQHYKDLDQQAVEAYVKGGPMWLYLTDRDFVMQMPVQWKRFMVQDVNKDSPKDAYDLGRDILKDTTAQGPESTVEAILGG